MGEPERADASGLDAEEVEKDVYSKVVYSKSNERADDEERVQMWVFLGFYSDLRDFIFMQLT